MDYIKRYLYHMEICFLLITASSGQSGPIPKEKEKTFTILRSIYRETIDIDNDAFADDEDGSLRQLQITFTNINGSKIAKDNWIQYHEFKLLVFTTRNTINNAPTNGYRYNLTATDSDGNTASTSYVFIFDSIKRSIPVYIMRLKVTSLSSTVDELSDVQNLFYLQENKLFPYSQQHQQGIDKLDDIITEELNITRRLNTESDISLAFSSKQFLMTTGQCNVQNIIKMRSKNRGEYAVGYQNKFKPEFNYVEQLEQFNGICNYLSGDKPISGGDNFKTASIKYGEYFTINIPSNVFKPPPTGNTMEITIVIRNISSNEQLPVSSWINVNANSDKLEGYIPYDVANSSTRFEFELTALTPLLEELGQLFTTVIEPFESIASNYIVEFASSTAVTINYSIFVKSFLSTMSNYLAIQESDILIYSYHSNNINTMIKWTLKEFSVFGFSDIKKLGAVTTKLTTASSQPNPQLSQQMVHIGFQLVQVDIQPGPNLQNPISLQQIGQIFTWGTFFKYFIPVDAYTDARDGVHLQFAIISDGSPFSSNNWLSADSPNRIIHGVPVADQIDQNLLSFTLRVTNSLGNYIDDLFYLQSKQDLQLFSYSFKITFTYQPNETSISNILYKFMSKLVDYFQDSNRNQIIVTNVITIPETRTVHIRYFNTSFKVTPCDTKAIVNANMKLFSRQDPNSELISAMSPEYQITHIITDSVGSCNTNYPPHVTDPRKLSSEVGPHIIKWGTVFYKQLSENLFTDEEDGKTKDLKITFKPLGSTLKLPMTSWIYYNETTFSVYAVPDQTMFNDLGAKNELKYILRAEDSGGKSVAVEYIVLPTGASSNLYNVTMSINLFGIARVSYAQQLVLIVKKIEGIFGSSYNNKICVKTYHVTTIKEEGGTAILTWTSCDLRLEQCNFDIINDIRRNIYTSGSNTINSNLNARFDTFQVVGVIDLGIGPCSLQPPEIKEQLPNQKITFCGLYTYQIHENAFVDKEDGSTRNLQLSLKQEGKMTLDDWIEFDQNSQTISMLLTKSMDNVLLERTQKLILTAKDASNLERSQVIIVTIEGNAGPVDYKYIIRLQPRAEFLLSKQNPFIEIARIVSYYFKDNGTGFEAIQTIRTSTGESVYEFGNCTIKYSPCAAVEMQEYRNKLKEPSFTSIFLPEFIISSTKESLSGPCAIDSPPEVDQLWSPIVVEITKTYVLTVPQNAFKDKEQGNTRELQLQLTDIGLKSLDRNFWVQFDVGSQTLTILATKDIALQLQPVSTLRLILFAFDVQRQVAQMTLEIQVLFARSQPSHYVSMSLTVFSTPFETSSFTEIYSKLRSDIITYFKDDIDFGVVSYLTASNLNSSLHVIWTNTSISRINCQKENIKYMTSQLFSTGNIKSQAFLSAVRPFNVVDMKLYYDGICKNQLLPPSVENPILPLKTTYCAYIHFTIPEDTFSDKIDGNTRQLSMELKFSNGTFVSEGNSYITFDRVNQTLVLIPVTKHFTKMLYPINFVLTATTKRGLSVSTNLQVTVEGDAPKYSFYFQVMAEWKDATTTSFAEILRDFIDKTAQYLGQRNHDINLLDATKSSPTSNIFTVRVALCKLRYDPCDVTTIKTMIDKITASKGESVNIFYQTALSSNIKVLNANTHFTGPCNKGNKTPILSRKIPDLTLNLCSTFEYKLDPDTFIDFEDGNDLPYVLYLINGKPINTDPIWLHTTSNKEIIAIVNNDVVSRGKHYQLTIRAYDSKELYIDATWNIRIQGNHRIIFHHFVINLTPKMQRSNEKFTESFLITKLINLFFADKNITNFISMTIDESNGNFIYSWSSCSLPNHCDRNGANQYFNQVNSKRFKNTIGSLYTVNSIEMISDENCKGNLNPPNPSRTALNLLIDACGGTAIVIPSNTFTDTEDGNTRNLQLTFQRSSGKPLPEWITYDSPTQTIEAFPTYEEAKTFQLLPMSFTLIAVDKSGLSSSIAVTLTVSTPLEAKYKYTFQYKINERMHRVKEMLLFTRKLALFLQSATQHVSIYAYQEVNGAANTTRQITIGNCSMSYNPCDVAALSNLKNLFIDANNFPTGDFQTAMAPLQIQFGLVDRKSPCIDAYNPPRVLNELAKLTVSYCQGYYEYKIPDNTFYDNQDGGTRNLQVNLQTHQSSQINSQSWIQFDSIRQTLYLYPLVYTSSSENAISPIHTFSLTATDSSKLISDTPVNIELQGPASVLSDCQIIVDFSTIKTNINHIHRLQYLNTKLREFFYLKSTESIAMVRYGESKQNVFKFQLSWSYCSLSFARSTTMDYHQFINRILMRLFRSDRKTVAESFYNAFGAEYTVKNVRTQFTGQCKDFPPIIPQNTPLISLTISSCGYTQTMIDATQFYDFEQGNAANLDLRILNSSLVEVSLEHWLNIDQPSRSIIAVCNDFVRNTFTKVFTFILRATDVRGQSTDATITITKLPYTNLSISPFDVTFEMEYKGLLGRPFVYQIRFIMQRIANYYKLSTTNEIYIKSYQVSPGYPEYRMVTWTICASTECSTKGILEKTQQIFNAQELLKSQFKSLFYADFNIEKVYYTSTQCSKNTEHPYVVKTLLNPLASQYCSIFTYNLPSNVFFDNIDGNTRRIKISLRDQQNFQLSRSSMVQFNNAKQQIYAVNVQSRPQSGVYTLVATNSMKFSTSTNISMSFQQIPYIVDCPITINFTYKYLTSNSKDVDILIKALHVIKEYYNDSSMQIKVLDFQRDSENNFQLKWTNCSFQFSTHHEAVKGLDETDRLKLTSIFSRIFNKDTNLVTPEFKNTFDQDFHLKSVGISYTCIEKSPVPNNDVEIKDYARYCRFFKRVLPNNLFTDEKDGDIRTMQLELAYPDGSPVSKHEWLQLNKDDKSRKYIYGIVTEDVETNADNRVYRYLIVCTDTSGRQATKSLLVTIIPSDTNTFTNEFIVGFKTTFSEDVPTAYVLASLTHKLTTFINSLDTTRQMYVKEFSRDSHIRFSYCRLTCSQDTFNKVYNDFQTIRYKTAPSLKLLLALREEFNVNYLYINSYKCLPASDVVILKRLCPSVSVPRCGYFIRSVSPDCFRGSTSRQSSKEFLLTMQEKNGSPISKSSWLQFDVPTQSVYGIIIWNRVTETQSFQITAQHPVSGHTTSNTLQVNVDDYSSTSTASEDVCRITLEFKETKQISETDIQVVEQLLQMISSYSNSGLNDLMVNSFNRSNTIISLTYTNCTWLNFLQNDVSTTSYLKDVFNILELYFRITELKVVGITTSFAKHIKQNGFHFVRVITSDDCANSPKTEPVPNKELTVKVQSPCGAFSQPVPEDTFTDKRFGDTRQLKLELISQDNMQPIPWVSVNDLQHIYGLIDKQIMNMKPSNGYQFLLRATNGIGQSSTTRVNVKLPDKEFKTEQTMKIQMFIPDFANDLVSKFTLIEQLENFPEFKSLTKSFTISKYETGGLVEIEYCQDCDAQYFLHASRVAGETDSLKNWLRKRFNVLFATVVTTGAKEFSKDCSPASASTPEMRELEFCASNVWYLSTTYTELIEQYNVKFLSTDNSELPLSSWINLLRKPYRVIGYPTGTLLRNQPPSGYSYKIVLQEEGQTVGVPQIFAFKIIGNPNRGEEKYTMEMKSSDTLQTRKSDVDYITETWKTIQILTSVKTSFQHASFVPHNTNTPFSYEISWYTCNKGVCKEIEVLGPPFITNTSKNSKAELNIVSGNVSCNDTASIDKRIYKIIIPVCGYFRYRLESSLDNELQNYNIELKNQDGSGITRDSWIRFDDLLKEIQAFPTQLVIDTTPKDGLQYQLSMTDDNGRSTLSYLIVNFEQGNRIPYYTYTSQIRSLYPITTPYLEIQKNTLNSIANYVSDTISNYQVISFTETSTTIGGTTEAFIMRIKNCSVQQYTCPIEKQQLEISSNGLTDNNKDDFKRKIRQASGGNIIVDNIVYKSSTLNDRPPVVVKNIPEISLDYCSSALYNIPNDIFDNREEAQLRYELYDSNNKIVPADFWVNLNETRLYAIPFINIHAGTYYFKLRAIDKCAQTAENPFIVKLSGIPVKSSFSLSMLFDRKTVSTLAQFIWDIKEKIVRCSGNVNAALEKSRNNGWQTDNSSIRSELFGYTGNRVEYGWSNCSLATNECKQIDIDKTTAYIFSSPNVISESFKKCFQDYGLLKIDESSSKGCRPGVDIPRPGVKNHPKFETKFCQKVEFIIDFDTFVDENGDGITKSLTLELFKENFDPLPKTEWIQFDQQRQRIYGYPRTGEDSTSVKTIYKYKLRATNDKGASSSTDLEITVTDIPVVNFVMSFEGKFQMINNRPDIDEEIDFIDKLKAFYQEGNLNDVALERSFGNKVEFKWSFCNKDETCDCNNIQRYKSLTSRSKIQQLLGNRISVQGVNMERKRTCGDAPNKLNPIPDGQVILVGQCFKYDLPKDSFFDKNGTLFEVQSENGKRFPLDHWLQVDKTQQHLCGILPYDTYLEGSFPKSVYNYQLVTKDFCENKVVTDATMKVNITSYELLNYIITITIYNRRKSNLASNCTDIELLFTKIATYSGVNKTDIYVKEMEVYNSTYENATRVTWGYKELRGSNCSNETLYQFSRKFFSNYTTVNFVDYMRPEYEVTSVTNRTIGECASPPIGLELTDPDFPWWITWVLIFIGVLALLFWFCWICLPRCCPTICGSGGCCGRYCNGCCWTCCAQSGKHSSFVDNYPNGNGARSGMLSNPSDQENRGYIDEDIISDTDLPEEFREQSLDEELFDVNDIPSDLESSLAKNNLSALPAIPSSELRTESYTDQRVNNRLLATPSPLNTWADEDYADNIPSSKISATRDPSRKPNIHTEAYVDDRHVDKKTLSSLERNMRRKRRSRLLQKISNNEGSDDISAGMFVERYKDRRRSSAVVTDDANPIVYKKKQYILDNTITNQPTVTDQPIILRTKSSSQTRLDLSDDDIVFKKVRRKKSRSESPSRRHRRIVGNPTVTFRVESQTSRHKRKLNKNKRATLVYKEPREEEFVTAAPIRINSRKVRYSVNGGDDSDYKISRTKILAEKRERGRSKGTMGSLTSVRRPIDAGIDTGIDTGTDTGTDTGIYEERLFQPRHKGHRYLPVADTHQQYPIIISRRHKSHSPSRGRSMMTKGMDHFEFNEKFRMSESQNRYHEDSYV